MNGGWFIVVVELRVIIWINRNCVESTPRVHIHGSLWTPNGSYYVLLVVLELVVSILYHISRVERLCFVDSMLRWPDHPIHNTNSTTVIIPIYTSLLNSFPAGIGSDDCGCAMVDWFDIGFNLFHQQDIHKQLWLVIVNTTPITLLELRFDDWWRSKCCCYDIAAYNTMDSIGWHNPQYMNELLLLWFQPYYNGTRTSIVCE